MRFIFMCDDEAELVVGAHDVLIGLGGVQGLALDVIVGGDVEAVAFVQGYFKELSAFGVGKLV